MNTALAGHRRLLIALAAMTMFTPMATDMYLPTFPSLAKDLIPESLSLEKRNDHGLRDSARSYLEIIKDKEFRAASIIGISGSFVTFAYVSSAPAVLMG